MDTQLNVKAECGGVSVTAHTGPKSTPVLPASGVRLIKEARAWLQVTFQQPALCSLLLLPLGEDWSLRATGT